MAIQVSRPSPLRKLIFAEVFGDKGWAFFLEARFVPRWLPFLLAIAIGKAVAGVIASGAWYIIIPLAILIPGAILFYKYPFVAVMLWMLVYPYLVRGDWAGQRYIYWLIHRAAVPVGLAIVILWLAIRKKRPVRFGPAELSMLLFLVLAAINICLLSQDVSKAPIHSRSLLDDPEKARPGEIVPYRPTPTVPRSVVSTHFFQFYDRVFIPFCMYWLIRLFAPQGKDLVRFLPVAFVTVIAQCGIGLMSWIAPQSLPGAWLALEGERTVGSFANAAVFTSTLLFLSLLLFQYGMRCKSPWIRTTITLTLGLAYLGVFFSFSRGSWLGGLVVLTGLLFLYPKVFLRTTVVFVVLLLILGSTLLVQQMSFASERLADTNTARGRIVIWATSIRMIIKQPWFGWGYANYDFYGPYFVGRVGDLGTDKYNTSHNTYLTIIAEMGFVGFVLYIFPAAWWLLLSIKNWHKLPRDGFWSSWLLAILWLSLLDQFVVSSFMDMISNFQFGTTVWWMTLGLIANMVYPCLKQGWRYYSPNMKLSNG